MVHVAQRRLLKSVKAPVAETSADHSIVPPDVFGPHPSTDGGFFHFEGVPLVNFLTAPMYLFDSQDTPDKIHEASLVPVTRAAFASSPRPHGKTAAADAHLTSPFGEPHPRI